MFYNATGTHFFVAILLAVDEVSGKARPRDL